MGGGFVWLAAATPDNARQLGTQSWDSSFSQEQSGVGGVFLLAFGLLCFPARNMGLGVGQQGDMSTPKPLHVNVF